MNEKQQALVNEYVEMFGFSEEQAIEMLKEEGKLGGGDSNVSFKPNLPELKFFNGALASPMTKHNKAAKKEKIKYTFEEDNFYLGAKTVKVGEGDEKKIDPKQTEIGIQVGEEAEIIVCSQGFYAGYYNPKNPSIAVTTNMVSQLFDAKKVRDFKTGKTIEELYETGKYGEKSATGQDKTIKWKRVVGLLVKTEDGWKKAFTEKNIGAFETDSFHSFLEATGDMPFKYLGKTKMVEWEIGNSYKVEKDRALTDDEFAEVRDLVLEVKREMQNVIKEQAEFVNNKSNSTDDASDDTSPNNPVDDGLDLDKEFGGSDNPDDIFGPDKVD